MTGSSKTRRFLGVPTVIAVVVIALVVFAPSALGGHVTGAAFTTTNQSVDGSGHCQNGNEDVNCNIYDGKQYVWLNGGPAAAGLDDGTYFFAVLVPGGQGGHENPNDGTTNNLSDPLGGDAWTCRIFDVSSHAITYPGATTACGSSAQHDYDSTNHKIRLLPYDDTTNPGGVYILAICKVPGTIDATNPPGAVPSNCKYDAFKVHAPEETPPASNLEVSKTALGSYDTSYGWTITKSVDDPSEVHQSGASHTFGYTLTATHDAGTPTNIGVTGSIDITNTNGSDVTVNVSDALSNNAPCTVKDGTDTIASDTDVSVPSGGKSLSYSCPIAGHDLPSDLVNNVTITWPEQFLDDGSLLAAGSANNHADVSFDQHDTLNECTTITDQPSGGSLVTLGEACVGGGWTLDNGNNLDSFAESYESPTFTFTYNRSLTGTSGTCTVFDNTAVSTPNDGGDTDSANGEAKLCVGADLTASKTATPAFTRTYRWTIRKDVDKTLVRTSGPSATFNYTVTVNSATPAYTDSGWQVTGSITVNNPNDWEAVTVDISDAVNNGGSCTVTNGTGVSVAASGSVSRDYTCTWSSAPSNASGTNTATVSWDSDAAGTPSNSTTGTQNFTFSSPTTETYKTIHVVDPAAPGGTLGTVTYGSTTLPAVFHYSKTITIDPTQCVSFDNTATITETSQSSSQTVRACPTVNGLTIGYWSNKNGQGRISGASASGGVCNLTGWLRGTTAGSPFYTLGGGTGPFHDLGSSSSCSQVATYVYNIIKSGSTNCSGTTCNPMLKAQMLATALNVYFSVTNGNEQIDLVHGCSMIDGSSGSGSCNGGESWSLAFGGATHLSVLQMLTYAASQDTSSGLNGSTWYGQVKSRQVLAKDAFDAINNGVALVF